jgi:8-oxo-dGTP diphosphatase
VTTVVAAIIERNGRILICRRSATQPHPLKWEFPGGKVEPGEEPRAALARELREELAIEARVGSRISGYEYCYPGRKPIRLVFYRVDGFEGEPRNLVFDSFTWEVPSRLPDYDFLEGDVVFLTSLQGGARTVSYTEKMVKMVEPAGNEFLAQLENKSKRVSYFFRTMANRPDVLKNFVPLYGAIMGRGSVELRVKELVYLTCSYANECAYCTAAHVASGTKAGVTEEEMRALQTQQDHEFSEPERAAIRYALELTQTADAAESRAALQEHFGNEQIVELTLVAAMANFTNRFNNGLQINPEPLE